jgi:ankyrin repeat protein
MLSLRVQHGRTPLHAAALSGVFELVWLVHTRGAAPSLRARDSAGRTPAEIAAVHEFVRISDALLEWQYSKGSSASDSDCLSE